MSRQDYGSQLWSPYLTKHINMVEKTQRSFTRYISGMQGLSYPERLTVLKLYSLQRRRERFIIIYVWKILECLVPNFSPIRSRTSDCRERACIASHVGVGRLGTLAYNSFRWHAICMFNLYSYLRGFRTVIFDKFKIFMKNCFLVKLCAKYNKTSNMIMPLCQKRFKYNCFNVFVTTFNMIKSIKQKKMNKQVVKKYFLTTCIVSMGPTN